MAGKTIISGSSSSGVNAQRNPYGNPLTVTGTINVSNGYGIYYSGGTATNWTIANQGVIAASTHGSGIMLGNADTTVTSGSVTNSNGGTIYGATSGIYVNGYGTVTNIGVSTISSQGIGVDIRLAGTVSNLSGGVISPEPFRRGIHLRRGQGRRPIKGSGVQCRTVTGIVGR